MAIGSVQLIVLGFRSGATVPGGPAPSDSVRVIHALTVNKDTDGAIAVAQMDSLADDESIALESTDFATSLGVRVVEVFSDAEAWDVLDRLPGDSAAALLLVERNWAFGLRGAIESGGGFRINRGFVAALDRPADASHPNGGRRRRAARA